MGLPNEVNSALIGAAAAGGYQINQSLRWRGSSSIYLSQSVNSAPTTSTSATLSFWMKAPQQNNGYLLFDCRNGSVDWGFQGGIKYESGFGWGDGTFGSAENATNVTNYWTLNQNSSQPALRDPSAWYHVVVIWDGNNGTSTSRMQVYVNGSQSYFYNYYGSIGSGASCPWTRNGYTLKVGGSSNSQFYMADLYCIDGQGLSPGNFAETDLITGAWIPKKYSGSYGNNGFYCKFDPSATNGIGHDHSGNGNNFSSTGFSTSGTGTDVFNDTPTNNWVTWNSVYKDYKGNNIPTYSEGNLSGDTAGQSTHFFATQAIQPGDTKGYYFEITADSIDTVRTYIGLIDASGYSTNTEANGASYQYDYKAILENTGNYFDYASGTGGGNPQGISGGGYGNGDTIMVAYKNGSIWLGKNGTWLQSGNPGAGTNAIATDLDTSIAWSPYAGYNSSFTANFGGGANGFQYTVPTGFVALNTANLPEPTIKDGSKYFDTLTWTGDSSGANRTFSGLAFGPDLVWAKGRNQAISHQLTDIVRGAGATSLRTDDTRVEGADGTSAGYLSAFTSDGFQTTSSSTNVYYNTNTYTYVAWCWDAGGAGSSNTAGTITSTVSANASAGFSIVTYTGTGSNATVGHGLGVAPKFVIFKARNTASRNWRVYHHRLVVENPSFPAAGAVYLDTTNSADGAQSDFTAASSTVLNLSSGAGSLTNESSVTYVAYCFSEVEGYSKFGRYTGNGSTDGPFVFCGFRPAWLLRKSAINAADDWVIQDLRRPGYNETDDHLTSNQANTEVTNSTETGVNILSNGFKVRSSNYKTNYSGATYIFAAFAELPFKYANAR